MGKKGEAFRVEKKEFEMSKYEELKKPGDSGKAAATTFNRVQYRSAFVSKQGTWRTMSSRVYEVYRKNTSAGGENDCAIEYRRHHAFVMRSA